MNRYTSTLGAPGVSDETSLVRSPCWVSAAGSTCVGAHAYPVPALLASLKVTVEPRPTSNDFPSSSTTMTVSPPAGASLVGGGATDPPLLGGGATDPPALEGAGAPSWHPWQARKCSAANARSPRLDQATGVDSGDVGGGAGTKAGPRRIIDERYRGVTWRAIVLAGGTRLACHVWMLRMPSSHVTDSARRNLDRFRATSAASELDDDDHTWTVVEWSWGDGPPLRIQLRSEAGQTVAFVMDESGVWRMMRGL
jgi:hypothetical protein